MRVYIPSALGSYTGHQREVAAQGTTLEALLLELDRRYPGFRFRIVTEQDTIRRHIRIFINQDQARHLREPLRPDDEIHIVCALSGG